RAADFANRTDTNAAAAECRDIDVMLRVDVHLAAADNDAGDIAIRLEFDIAADNAGTAGVDVMSGAEINECIAGAVTIKRDLNDATETGINAPFRRLDGDVPERSARANKRRGENAAAGNSGWDRE